MEENYSLFSFTFVSQYVTFSFFLLHLYITNYHCHYFMIWLLHSGVSSWLLSLFIFLIYFFVFFGLFFFLLLLLYSNFSRYRIFLFLLSIKSSFFLFLSYGFAHFLIFSFFFVVSFSTLPSIHLFFLFISIYSTSFNSSPRILLPLFFFFSSWSPAFVFSHFLSYFSTFNSFFRFYFLAFLFPFFHFLPPICICFFFSFILFNFLFSLLPLRFLFLLTIIFFYFLIRFFFFFMPFFFLSFSFWNSSLSSFSSFFIFTSFSSPFAYISWRLYSQRARKVKPLIKKVGEGWAKSYGVGVPRGWEANREQERRSGDKDGCLPKTGPLKAIAGGTNRTRNHSTC